MNIFLPGQPLNTPPVARINLIETKAPRYQYQPSRVIEQIDRNEQVERISSWFDTLIEFPESVKKIDSYFSTFLKNIDILRAYLGRAKNPRQKFLIGAQCKQYLLDGVQKSTRAYVNALTEFKKEELSLATEEVTRVLRFVNDSLLPSFHEMEEEMSQFISMKPFISQLTEAKFKYMNTLSIEDGFADELSTSNDLENYTNKREEFDQSYKKLPTVEGFGSSMQYLGEISKIIELSDQIDTLESRIYGDTLDFAEEGFAFDPEPLFSGQWLAIEMALDYCTEEIEKYILNLDNLNLGVVKQKYDLISEYHEAVAIFHEKNAMYDPIEESSHGLSEQLVLLEEALKKRKS